MSKQTEDVKWLSSLSSSPVLLSLEPTYHFGEGATGFASDFSSSQPCDVYSLLDHELLNAILRCSPTVSRGICASSYVKHLVSLTLQRHILSLIRDFSVSLKSTTDLIMLLCAQLQQRTIKTAELQKLCMGLRDQIRHTAAFQKKVSGNCWLRIKSSTVLQTTRDMQRIVTQRCVQAALLTEQCVESVLIWVSSGPMQDTGELAQSLTVYNHVVSEVWKWSDPWKRPEMFPLSRVVALLAEKRGLALAQVFCRSLCLQGVDIGIRNEMGHATQWQPFVGSGQALVTLIQEDWFQVSTLLQTFVCSDPSMWHPCLNRPTYNVHGSDMDVSASYSYHLWPSVCTHIYSALYEGLRQSELLPALSACGQAVSLQVINTLHDVLASAAVPEQCRPDYQRLFACLLSTCVFITWDQRVCQALSSAMNDKCVAQSSSDVHSRTAGILSDVCHQLSLILHRPVVLGSMAEDLVLSRCVVSIQLCSLWLRSRTQHCLSTGALSNLVLLTHGDMPALQKESLRLNIPVTETESKKWLQSHKLRLQIHAARTNMEDLAVSLPHSLGLACERHASQVFQKMMPGGRHWRGRFSSDLGITPSDYAIFANHTVLAPVLDGMNMMTVDRQICVLSVALTRFMEAWMGHILREKLRFSLQGALQLRCDFETVRGMLRSPSSGLPLELIEVALSLPVFQQSENAITCLLQQPSSKAYLPSRTCPLLWCCPLPCRAAVETMSDSLQSLDSLERRAWSTRRSANLSQHSHDSYLPHSQQQWLSLRVHKRWDGLRVPWEGQEMSAS